MPAENDRRVAALQAADAQALRLFERVRAEPRNAALREVIEAGVSQIAPTDLRLVLVPGMLYRHFPDTGADGALLRSVAQRLGLSLETIPVDGTLGLDGGADVINDWLEACPRDRRILLFSLSKGSNEVRHALTRPGASAFRHVSAWISVSGLPFGSPAVDLTLANPLRRLVLKPWCRFKGWSYELLRDALRHRPQAPFELPPHLRFVQIAAFPLQEHLRDRRSRRLRRGLAPLGASDGFVLLEEITRLPGALYPIWGADHYLNGCAHIEARLAALIRHLATPA